MLTRTPAFICPGAGGLSRSELDAMALEASLDAVDALVSTQGSLGESVTRTQGRVRVSVTIRVAPPQAQETT